ATGGLLAIQQDFGNSDAYVAIPSGEYALKQVGTYLEIGCIPSVNAWWDIEGSIMTRCDTAAYSSMGVGVRLLGTDADGVASPERGIQHETQHSGVNLYHTSRPQTLL